MNTLLAILFVAQVSLSSPGFVDQLVAPVTAAGCSTVRDDNLGTDYTTVTLSAGQTNYVGGRWTAGASYTLCSVSIRGIKVNSPTQNITPQIWSDSSGPSALLDSGTQFNLADWPSSSGTITLSGFSQPITSGSSYWLVLKNDSSNSTTSYGAWYAKDANFVSNRQAHSADASTWSLLGSRAMSIKTYSE